MSSGFPDTTIQSNTSAPAKPFSEKVVMVSNLTGHRHIAPTSKVAVDDMDKTPQRSFADPGDLPSMVVEEAAKPYKACGGSSQVDCVSQGTNATSILPLETMIRAAAKNPWKTQDPIHGLIELPAIVRYVIDTPEFQRLRDLHQLGLSHRVFVTAEHTRFEHSIGTAKLAYDLIIQLARTLDDKLAEKVEITYKDVLCVTLAGLCHDLGHGPFSHTWDGVIIPELTGQKLDHEEMSLIMWDALRKRPSVKAAFKEVGLDECDQRFVGLLFDPPKPSQPWPERLVGRPASKRFLAEVVSNKRIGIDVDKLDYLQRDCFMTGTSQPREAQRILRTATVNIADGHWQIVWPVKEVENLYEVYHARERMFRRVYGHPVTRAIEVMLKDALLLLAPLLSVRGSTGMLPIEKASRDPQAYLLLNDKLEFLLREGIVGHNIQISDMSDERVIRAQKILRDINERRLYKVLGSVRGRFEEGEIDRHVNKFCAFAKGQISPSEIEIRNKTLRWSSCGTNPLANARFVYRRGCPAMAIRQADQAATLPKEYTETNVIVIAKFCDPDRLKAADEAFEKWQKSERLSGSSAAHSSKFPTTPTGRLRRLPSAELGLSAPCRAGSDESDGGTEPFVSPKRYRSQ